MMSGLTGRINPLTSNPVENYTYDPVGNRLDSNQNGLSVFNIANQLEEDGDFTYTYDNNGNLTNKTAKAGGDFTSYEYDAENKLVRVVTPGKTVNYDYDGLGRRVEKEIIEVTTTVTRYIYDNEDILLELDGSNNIVARYTHGLGIDEPLIIEKAGASFFYHADGLGSITELTDTAGTVAQSYTYSSFGKIESQLDSNFIQPYTLTAREFDPETGLYFYRARYYDPTTGRFLQEDLIGFAGGINFYLYVQNGPTNLVDPDGLIVFFFGGGIGAGAGKKLEPKTGDLPNYYSASAVGYLGTRRSKEGIEEGTFFTGGAGRIVGIAAGGGLVAGMMFGDVEDLEADDSVGVGILLGPFSLEVVTNECLTSLRGISVGFLNKGVGLGAFGEMLRSIRVPQPFPRFGTR